MGRTGGSGDLGKPSVDQSFWGKSTNMDLGYYSLCRWDGQNPCGFLCEEGGNHRGTIKMEIHSKNGDTATYLGQRCDIVEVFFFLLISRTFPAEFQKIRMEQKERQWLVWGKCREIDLKQDF